MAKKVNKAALVGEIQDAIGSTKADAERAMETVIDTIVDTLADAGQVSIAGLGIFDTRMRKARTARNPRTGEPIEVPAMRVPKFRAAKNLKDRVKGKK